MHVNARPACHEHITAVLKYTKENIASGLSRFLPTLDDGFRHIGQNAHAVLIAHMDGHFHSAVFRVPFCLGGDFCSSGQHVIRINGLMPFNLRGFACNQFRSKEIDVDKLRPHQHKGHYTRSNQSAKRRGLCILFVCMQRDIIIFSGKGKDLFLTDDDRLKIIYCAQPDIFKIHEYSP